MSRARRAVRLCLLCLSCAFWGLVPAALAAQQVAVVLSAEIRPYVEALDGLREALEVPIAVYDLAANPDLVRLRLQREDLDLVVAIGPQAAELVWSGSGPARRVALMVLDPGRLLGPPAPCGVDLRVPIGEQVRLIAENLGAGRRMGILYNPSESAQWVAEADEAAKGLGVRFVPLPVEERRDVLPTLTAAYGEIDTLLFIPDPAVISETLLRHLVKEALLNGVAVVGYNQFFLEIGAALAFVVDYRAVGLLGALLVKDCLAGRPCTLEPPPYKIEINERAVKLWQRTRPPRDQAQRQDAE